MRIAGVKNKELKMIGCRRKLMYFSMSSLFCLGVWGCQPGDGPNSPSATPGGTRVMDSGGAKGRTRWTADDQ